MSRHRFDPTRDQLRVPVLARRYNIQHPGSLPLPALLQAQQTTQPRRTDTAALPAIIARAASPLRPVTA